MRRHGIREEKKEDNMAMQNYNKVRKDNVVKIYKRGQLHLNKNLREIVLTGGFMNE